MIIQPLDLIKTFDNKPAALDFVLPGLLSGTVAMLAAPGAAGKSFLALQSAMSISCGNDLFNIWGEHPLPGHTLVLAVEDPAEILQHRIHNIGTTITEPERAMIAERMAVMPLFGNSFGVACKNANGIFESAWIEEIIKYCKDVSVRLIIIDTLNRSLGGLDENSNGDMGALLAILESISKKTGAAIMILHHMNKGSVRDGATDQAASRGASALVDNCRWSAGMMTMTPGEAEKRGIPEDQRRSWVKLDLSKINYSKPESVRWLRRSHGGMLVGDEPPDFAQVSKGGKNAGRKAGGTDEL